MKQLLIDQYEYREEDIVVMMDDDSTGDPLWPTRENILREVRLLAEGASYLDRRFLYFTGHGTNSICDHQSEVDMLDEAIVDGCGVKVIDNDLHDALCGRLSVGPDVIALFDCCHSATILDLPHVRCNELSPRLSPMDMPRSPIMQPLTNMALDSPRSTLRLLQSPTTVSITVPALGDQFILGPKRVVKKCNNRSIRKTVSRFVPETLCELLRSPKLTSAIVTASLLLTAPAIAAPWGAPSRSKRAALGLLRSSFIAVYMAQSLFVHVLKKKKSMECRGGCTSPRRIDKPSVLKVCISACRDHERAWEDHIENESFTTFFIDALRNKPDLTYEDLLLNVRHRVRDLTRRRLEDNDGPRDDPDQRPVLGSFYKLDLKQPFYL
ncbi:hypothetical protein CONPUDRAFT_138708 [Coniophora puteana RWD-64-598 SS2]|uniref:Peptidase C14 caspase domain-containing protein n=1 Tax=Coniophora puteana (strain RWD-64-598) TaxID=741705 RepID=A0A5M3MI12_CONPW|nr:uncharacterized protein CONPUDRAFT_138708 [Coniophora puteana RWD-64-598 SS2]EIW78424.1 hypothetical protein CONPUDRAFT_138708 [Coniophora puteana RWD-64-598 SS2]